MRRSSLARPLTAAVAAVLISGALVGCTGFSIDGSCTPKVPSGDASSTITATGKVGTKPQVDFPTPLVPAEAQLSVLSEGTGTPIQKTDVVQLEYSGFDAKTGESVGASGYPGDGTISVLVVAGESSGAIGDSFLCATRGSRIAVVAPVESFDPTADPTAKPSGNVALYVFDIIDVYLGKANGFNQLPLDGMPTVVTAVDGTPGISVLAKSLPSEKRVELVKAGGGETVANGDTVVYQVRTWDWAADDSVTVSSADNADTWAKQAPQVVVIAKDSPEPLSDVIGSKVGSQILTVIPAADSSKGAKIYVIDVLGIAHTG